MADDYKTLKAWQWREIAPEERFRRRYTIDDGGCWIFGGRLNHDGYGTMFWNGHRYLAHQISYLWNIGDIPEELEIDHTCKNRACVNPEHLEAVAHRVNVMRGSVPGPHSHCKRGHAMDGTNVGFAPKWQKRYCKACRKVSSHAWNKRQ